MSEAFASAHPAASLRQTWTRLWNDPDSRSVVIGVAAVILVHLFLLLLAPRFLQTDTTLPVRPRAHVPRQFSIEMTPDMFKKPLKPPPPNKFVETNPNAPDNVPDKTNNFAAQNQQAAQEKPQAKAHNDHPQQEGRTDIRSTQIVTGQLQKPQEIVPPAPTAKVQPKTTAAPRRAQNPLSGFDKTVKGDDANGYMSNLAKVPDNNQPMPQKVEGSKDAPLVSNATNTEAAIDPHHPRPRPQLEKMNVRPAIFQENKFGTSNMGVSGWDARWSNYGAYLQKMIEAIQIQWDRILIESQTSPPPGSQVSVKFRIDSKGQITEIIDVQSTSSDQGKESCVSAITSRAPYGDWTDDMIAVLGTSQEMTFTFFYQ